MMKVHFFLSVCWLIRTVSAEITVFSGPLPASSSQIQYATRYLIDPGFIDLSKVTFTAVGQGFSLNTNVDDDLNTGDSGLTADDSVEDRQDPSGGIGESIDDNQEMDDEFTVDDTVDGDDGRSLAINRSTVIDIIFFHEPFNCVKDSEGCDWTRLGIGTKNLDGNEEYCCTESGANAGLCLSDNVGRLIIDSEIYGGEHRPLLVSETGEFSSGVNSPIMSTTQGTGKYTLAIANCNDFGRDVYISGKYTWKSKGGYLPGDLFDEFHFFILFMIVYFVLFLWYGKSMRDNRDATIGIQKWILGTLLLGLVELIFKTMDYFVWNLGGTRNGFILYAWIVIGVLKGAISRCLLVMVSLGWGVVRDNLGDQLSKIIVLGIVFSVCAFLRDVAEIVFVEEMQVWSLEKEEEVYDIYTILTFLVAAIDCTFYMWILDSLNSTMQYLENMNQSNKLKRYLRLRLILLISILFGIVWAVFGIVDTTMDTSILNDGQEWIIRAMWVVNYTFVLVGIVMLWKPNARAKEFAYVMELPSIGDDTVLQQSTAIDDEEEDEMNVRYSNNRNGMFTIDDGEMS